MKLSRRSFLKGSAALAVTPVAAKAGNVFANNDERRVLVGVFLLGGNDAYNMVAPRNVGPEYEQYELQRKGVMNSYDSLIDTGLTVPSAMSDSVSLGLHPSMSSLSSMFEQGNANIIINSGQLVEPIVRSAVESPVFPDFLMAHNQQQVMWQSGALNMASKYGWAGKMVSDMPVYDTFSPMMSLNGDKHWLRGERYAQLAISSNGMDDYAGERDVSQQEMSALWDEQYSNLFLANYANHAKGRYAENAQLKDILEHHEESYVYPGSALGAQLKMAGRLIRAGEDLGQKKQVIMVGIGGFDTHHNQKIAHAGLMEQLAGALSAFHDELEAEGLLDVVTTFTMSDFGRRFPANQTGTDHGWGGHQLIMGGAIKGKNETGGQAFGRWPDLNVGSEYDHNNGRLIPEVAADQVHAELAEWFGYPKGQLNNLFSNHVHFEDNPLHLFK